MNRTFPSAGPVIAALSSLLALVSCSVSPGEMADKYGLPSDPFDAVLLQVVDRTRAHDPQPDINLIWNLHLSDPAWAEHLGAAIFITPPGSTVGDPLQDEVVVRDADRNILAVEGRWENTLTGSVTFGSYDIGFTLVGTGARTPPVYTKAFAARGPDGKAEGTYYTDASTAAAKATDVTDFRLTMYSDGLGIAISRGTLSRADSLVFDFYTTSSSSAPLAELALTSQAIAELAAKGEIIVRPAGLAALYGDYSVTTGTTGWYCEYFTIDDPDSPASSRTLFIYTGNDWATNDVASTAPTGLPVVSLSKEPPGNRDTTGRRGDVSSVEEAWVISPTRTLTRSSAGRSTVSR